MSKTQADEPTITLAMLKGSFAMRAKAYAHFFDVLREEFGPDKAVELFSKATRRLGCDMGAAFSHLAPGDINGLKEQFLAGIPCADDLFAPEVLKCDEERLEIQFHRCPLKDNWVDQGRSEEDLELMCKAAGAIDGGLFETAGFTFKGSTWKAGQSGCCRLVVEPGPNKTT